MRKLTAIALIAPFVLIACGRSPQALCEQQRDEMCANMHECTPEADKDDFWHDMWGADAAECETILENGKTIDVGGFEFEVEAMNCAGTTADNACEGATDENQNRLPVFNQDKAEECVDGFTGLTCEEWNSDTFVGPAACDEVCTAE